MGWTASVSRSHLGWSQSRPAAVSRRTVLGLFLIGGGVVGAGAGAYSFLAPAPAAAARPVTPSPFTVTPPSPVALAKESTGTDPGIAGGQGGQPGQAPASKPAPSTVAIPSLGLELGFLPTGTTGAGAGRMVIPESPQIAWLNSTSPLSAATGSTFLAGHVDFADGSLSPMARISTITPNAVVVTTDHDGARRTWRVTSLNTYTKTRLPESFFQRTGPRVLVLATCGGPVVTMPDGALNYADNTVVTAVPA